MTLGKKKLKTIKETKNEKIKQSISKKEYWNKLNIILELLSTNKIFNTRK